LKLHILHDSFLKSSLQPSPNFSVVDFIFGHFIQARLSQTVSRNCCVLDVGRLSGKSGPKDQVALHYYYTSPSHWYARLTRYRNCKFHNFARTISRHAHGISRYSVSPSAGPLLPLGGLTLRVCGSHESATAQTPLLRLVVDPLHNLLSYNESTTGCTANRTPTTNPLR